MTHKKRVARSWNKETGEYEVHDPGEGPLRDVGPFKSGRDMVSEEITDDMINAAKEKQNGTQS
tara:strand:+ start:824 stop:1012 length:189 start_codon:yes stop_codon:yes gene_type:complete